MKKMFNFIIVILFAIMPVFISCIDDSADSADCNEVTLGAMVCGSITTSDSICESDPCHFDTYCLTATEGITYRIEISSTSGDPVQFEIEGNGTVCSPSLSPCSVTAGQSGTGDFYIYLMDSYAPGNYCFKVTKQ